MANTRDTEIPSAPPRELRSVRPSDAPPEDSVLSQAVPPQKASAVRPSEIEQARLDAGMRARAARDAFSQVMTCRQRRDIEAADAALSDAKERTVELWADTKVRSSAFRSLLGAIDVAIRFRSIAEFDDVQLNCLMAAYSDLPKNNLEQSDVSRHIVAFAKANIDLTEPLRERSGTTLRITIERTK